jgi:hypothetical protein
MSTLSKAAAAMGRAGTGEAKRRGERTYTYRCEECDREIAPAEYEHLVEGEAMACPDHPQATILSCPDVSAHYRAIRARRGVGANRPKTKLAQLFADAVTVVCPCGEAQPCRSGSLMWTDEDFARDSGAQPCCSCDQPLHISPYAKVQFLLTAETAGA